MLRPISLFLLMLLIFANRYNGDSDTLHGVWLCVCLFAIPCVAILVARTLKRSPYSTVVATNAILLSFGVAIVVFSWQTAVRTFIGMPILLDDVLLLLPALFWLLVLWWVTAPIDNKTSYVFHRLRLDVLLLGIPLFILIGVSETASFYNVSDDWMHLVDISALLILLGYAPQFIAWILPAKRMRQNELLEQLVAIGKKAKLHNVKFYVWNTHNRIMNALAFGMAFQSKTIVLTDKLIASLTLKELHAVVAHELAHHKYWHVPFFVVTGASVIIWSTKIFGIFDMESVNSIAFPLQMVCIVGAVVLVSRQFEEQADAYAAVDQSTQGGSAVITEDGVRAMCSALTAIADVHSIPLDKNDPMHRSISARQKNLASIVGMECAQLPINKKVLWVKVTLLATLIGGILA